MNKGRIVRDKDKEVYLMVKGGSLKKPVYFQIEKYNTKPNGRLIYLSESFLIDLK